MIRKYELTPEHRAQMKPTADRWIANALRTGPYTGEEIEKIHSSMKGLYEAANLECPNIGIFCPSPITGAFVWGIASSVYEIRSKGTQKAIGRPLTDDEVVASALAAAKKADLPNCTHVQDGVRQAIVFVGESSEKADSRAVSWMLSNCSKWSDGYDGGNQWSGWPAMAQFFRTVANLHEYGVDFSKWIHYERLAEVGPRFMHSKFWIVCSRPDVLKVENRVQHSERGPSCLWPDGRAIYQWRGISVPPEWLDSPETIDPEIALTHKNVELRRCAAEIIGWGKVIEKLNPKTIDSNPDPEIGDLIEVFLNGEPSKFSRVTCPTGRVFCLPVPYETKTAHEAQCWMWDDPDYSPEVYT